MTPTGYRAQGRPVDVQGGEDVFGAESGESADQSSAGARRRRLIVEADGGSRGNPGPAAYGAVVRDTEGRVLNREGLPIGVATNNVAEYSGLIAGLEMARDAEAGAEVEVRMDSKLVIEQMAGRWKVKHPAMIPLAQRARALRPSRVTWTWIPREQNHAADALVNQALDGDPVARSTAPRPQATLPPAPGEPRDVTYAWRGGFDNHELNALHAEAFGYPAREDDWRSALERHSLGWVTAREDGELVGFVNVVWDGGVHGFVVDTAVASRAQRRGIGRALIAVAEQQARAARLEWLHVDFEDHLKCFYYDACGFTPTAAGLIDLTTSATS